MNFVDHGMASHWPVNIHHLLGRVAVGGDFGYGGAGAVMASKQKQTEAWNQMPAPESAFLGPQLWDRKICMKMNEIGWAVGHSGGGGGYQHRGYSESGQSTPSPTHFQQNYVDNAGVVHEPHSSTSWAKDDHKINFKMEPGYPGCSREGPEEGVDGFSVSKVDLALATVPGLDFDPTKRSFSAEELKPQPIIKKRKKIITPECKKDDQYWCKRSKNNFAAKRSREARRLKENQIALRASYLERQNVQLKMSLKELHIENNNMKVSVEAMMSKIKQREVYKSQV